MSMGMVYYWLYHTVQKRGSMQSTSCPTSISLVRQAYLVKAFCLPPKVNDLGSLSFLDGVLVMEQTEQAHGINHRCKTATNDSAGKQTLSGHFRPIVHPEVVTHPCCEWLELAGWQPCPRTSFDVLWDPPTIQTWEWCLLINGEKPHVFHQTCSNVDPLISRPFGMIFTSHATLGWPDPRYPIFHAAQPQWICPLKTPSWWNQQLLENPRDNLFQGKEAL